jgi:cytochrome c oxidase cbb3-type subunit 3
MEKSDQSRKPNPDDEVHHVDGIVELNHPAPFWWQSIYYVSIVWAVFYMIYYLAGMGPTLSQELAADLQKIEANKVTLALSPEAEKAELRSAFKDPQKLAAGLAVFQKNCASCHTNDGGGAIGPNLTDDHWINGDGSIDAISKVVSIGVPEKGMPPWGPILKHEESIAVSAFVRSLRGKTPAKAKAPQGNVVKYGEDI